MMRLLFVIEPSAADGDDVDNVDECVGDGYEDDHASVHRDIV